jgi:hypothetical protein
MSGDGPQVQARKSSDRSLEPANVLMVLVKQVKLVIVFLSEYAAITSLLLPFRPMARSLRPAAVTTALRSGTRPPAPISTRWKDMCKCPRS